MSIFAKRIIGSIFWFPCLVVLYEFLWKIVIYEPLTTWLFKIFDMGLGRQPKEAAIVSLIQALAVSLMFFPYYWLWFIYGRQTSTTPHAIAASPSSRPLPNSGAENLPAASEIDERAKEARAIESTTTEGANSDDLDLNKTDGRSEHDYGSKSKVDDGTLSGIDNEKGAQSVNVRTRKTLYDILGVPEIASHDEILDTHRRLVQRWHSDKHFGYRRATEQKLQWLNRAHEILIDQKKRELYDRQLSIRRGNN